MVFSLVFYSLFFASAISENTSVVTYGGSTEHVYSGSANTSTENPVDDKDISRIRPEALSDPKCPYASTLLQLLNILLEFLNYSSELEKVNKVLTFMQTYLEGIPESHERDALFMKLKLIEHQLLHNERPHDFVTPDTFTSLESTIKTTIVFKNDIPNISQPNCKEEFARLLQTAYNAYNEVAKFPNCQNNGYPSNEGLFFNNVYSINPKKPYQFDINYHISPPPKTDDQHVNNDGFNMQYPNLPLSPNPYLNLYSFWTNLPGNNLNLPNQPENNPFNFDKSPQLNNNLLDALNTLQNNPLQNNPLLNNPLLNDPLQNDLLQNNPLQNPDLINYLPGKPNNPNPKDILPYYDSSSQNFLPNPYYPYIPGGTTIQPNEVEPTPGSDNIKKPYLDNSINTILKDPKDELKVPGHGIGVDKVPPNLEAILNLLASPDSLYSNLEKLQNSNDVDYSVLLSQLGIPLPPNKINYQPGHSHPNIPESRPTQDNNMLTGLPGSNSFPGSELINNKNPFLVHQEYNPKLSDLNGLLSGKDNSKETIIDKMSIPFQYDKVTVNHDTIPYILEYIASSKKLPYQNNDAFLKGNQFDNYGTLVNNNAFQKPISSDLQRLYDGMANLGKLPNKAGLIELTYVLKRPKPVVYNPVYYVKYRVPYSAFVQNYQTLIASKPVLRSGSDQFKFYQDLLSLSNVTEVSPDLQGYGKEDIFKLVFDNGALVKARLVNGNDKYMNEQLQIIQGLNSNSTPEDISRLLNATLGITDSDADRKQLFAELFPTAPRLTVNVDANLRSDNKSWPFFSLSNDPSGPLLNLINEPISQPDKPLSTQENPYKRPVNSINKAFVPPQYPNKNDYLPHINWKDGSLVPHSYSNNNQYSPSMNTNNSPYAPSLNPNNSPYAPSMKPNISHVPSLNLNNSPYAQSMKPNISPYVPSLNSNNSPYAPSLNTNNNPYAPSLNPNNSPYAPSLNPNNSPYAPSLKPNNNPYAPSLNPNNNPYAPSLNPNNSPYAVSLNPNNSPYAPSLNPNNSPYAPSLNPNNSPYAPSLNPNNSPYAPPMKPNNSPYAQPMKPNNSPYAPSMKPNNSPYAPSLNPNNNPYAPSLIPNNNPYAKLINSNSKIVAPPGNNNYNALNQPKFVLPNVGYNQQVNGN